MFWKICDLRNFAKSRVNSCAYNLELYQRLATLLKKLPGQVFCCNLREFCKNTFFTEHLRATASVIQNKQFLENLQNSQENTYAITKTLFKKRLTGVFLWILRNFYEQLILRTPRSDCFWICVIEPFVILKTESNDRYREARFVLFWSMLFFINRFLRCVLF